MRARHAALFFIVVAWLCSTQATVTQAAVARSIDDILADSGIEGGLVVHVGCGDGKRTAELHADERYLVQGLDTDASCVQKAREHVKSLGLYGRVSIDTFDGKHLPYADNLVNLLVADDLGDVSMAEVLRVLAPEGVACTYTDQSPRGSAKPRWIKTVKPRPAEMDQWTHFLHDATGNAVAEDTLVGHPRSLQWVAKPLYCRSHEIDSSVPAVISAGSRMFYIHDEGLIGITDPRLPARWSLVARDAFSGVLLWKRPIPRWGWRQWKRGDLEGKNWTQLSGQRTRFPAELPRRLVAEGNRVYVTLGYAAGLSILDAASGEIIRTCPGTEGTHEIVLSDGIVVARLTGRLAEQTARRSPGAPAETIVAIDARSGDVLWRKETPPARPLTLAVGDRRVIFQTAKELVCLDLDDGAARWQQPTTFAQTLVVRDGVVLTITNKALRAFSAETGEPLWTGPGEPRMGAGTDLFVTGGLVWLGRETSGWADRHNADTLDRFPGTGAQAVGYDLKTGDVRKTIEVDNFVTPGHHYRCYRSKATSRFLLWPKRGVEFLDLEGSEHLSHDWIRGSCRYGIMPANGMLYVPPDQCFCYMDAKVNGFLALASERSSAPEPSTAERLERGPAYQEWSKRTSAQATKRGASASDWPTFRHDAARSGSTGDAVSAQAAKTWTVELGGRLTQPVVAEGRLFVAAVDQHTIHALDAVTGRPLWTHTAAGRIDSPPTLHEGLVLFGSADGRVQCLRATDGALVWRFLAATNERRVVAFEQLESPSPVHGNVLVTGGVAYFTAGRSTFLDGGIRLYGLDPHTGKLLHQTCLEGPRLDLSKEIGYPFHTEAGTNSDVLVTDGSRIYLRHIVFDTELVEQETRRVSRLGDRITGRHLFSTSSLLDDTTWNRTFWTYSERWPGFQIGNQAPKSGQMLVFDESTTFAVKYYTQRNKHSPMFFPATTGYLLFADDNDNEPIMPGEPGAPDPIQWLPEVQMPPYDYRGHHYTNRFDNDSFEQDKCTGFSRAKPPKWQTWVPVRVRAMTLAGDTLFAAGPPDVLDPDDPLAAFEGRKGGSLWAVSTTDGKKLAELPLDAPPVFDGLIAAGGRLYLSTADGHLLCFE